MNPSAPPTPTQTPPAPGSTPATPPSPDSPPPPAPGATPPPPAGGPAPVAAKTKGGKNKTIVWVIVGLVILAIIIFFLVS